MGLGPAGTLANATCFYYEITYLARITRAYNKHRDLHPGPHLTLAQEEERHRLQNNMYMMILFTRYIDDCNIPSINDTDPKTILYDNRTATDGTQDGSTHDGIYPTEAAGPNGTTIQMPCELEEVTAPARRFNYLDYEVVVSRRRNRVTTKVFDKRQNMPQFADDRTFPHHASIMPENIKLNVIISQLVRYSRRTTTLYDFVASCSCLITLFIDHGYHPDKVLRRVRAFGTRHWHRRALRLGRRRDFYAALLEVLPQRARPRRHRFP